VTHVAVQPATGASACDLPNDYMDAQIVVKHNGNVMYTAPLASCTFSTSDPCMGATSQGSHSCSSSCGGSYWGVATFDFSLVSGAALIGPDPECTFNSTTALYRCVFTGSKVKV